MFSGCLIVILFFALFVLVWAMLSSANVLGVLVVVAVVGLGLALGWRRGAPKT